MDLYLLLTNYLQMKSKKVLLEYRWVHLYQYYEEDAQEEYITPPLICTMHEPQLGYQFLLHSIKSIAPSSVICLPHICVIFTATVHVLSLVKSIILPPKWKKVSLGVSVNRERTQSDGFVPTINQLPPDEEEEGSSRILMGTPVSIL